MLSYIFEFNLNVSGEEADRYLATVLRLWPVLYGELEGVRGTLLLANAFALGGDYSYSCRVDIESAKSLGAIDAAIKSNDKRWKQARADWFQRRTSVRARLLRDDSDNADYLKRQSGLLHYVLAFGGHGSTETSDAKLQQRLAKTLGSASGVQGVQRLTAAVSETSKSHELWVRLTNVSALDAVSASNGAAEKLLAGRTVSTRLFGELREVDGRLIAGA